MRWIALVAALTACTPARADGVAPGGGLLATYCAKCHGPKRAESDFGFAADTPRLVASGMIVPGDPDASIVVRRIEAGEMPPAGSARPSKLEVAAFRRWIAAMPTSGTVRDESALARVLSDDAASLDAATRASSRWLTLTHLANAGVPDSQLDAYRSALAILLVSLSWAPAPNAIVAVDRERTVFRIDLRELGWTSATWDEVLARYPYGVARPSAVPDTVRADWFVATASRGALYNSILGLPDREDELARLLGIDLSTTAGARAGFNDSGVSVNNRVIERRATRHGAYWRSFDFSSSIGFSNVFRHPLDFVPAGGEIIFNLPDGMQAYMLVDATGRRIDKAPTTIVSDARRRDRAVENAVSCIGCHGAGIVEHTDAVRGSSTDDRVQRLYSDADALTRVYADDRARFASALDTVAAKPQADPDHEPVTLLTARYEADLDVRLAAAELGLPPADLVNRIKHDTTHLRDLAALRATGGTIKRDAWEAAFPRVIAALGLGQPATTRERGTAAAPAIWIDRERHTWIGIDGALDRDSADRTCGARSAALPAADELLTAVAQGLAGGIRLADTRVWTRERKLDAANQRYAIVVDVDRAASTRASPTDRHATICIQRSTEVTP